MVGVDADHYPALVVGVSADYLIKCPQAEGPRHVGAGLWDEIVTS